MSLEAGAVAEALDARSGRLAVMPQIDDGPTDGPPGRPLKAACVTLSVAEARELLESLQVWGEEAAEGFVDPGWHTHVTDSEGNELTIAIGPGEGGGKPSGR
jgi:hypothetical protein